MLSTGLICARRVSGAVGWGATLIALVTGGGCGDQQPRTAEPRVVLGTGGGSGPARGGGAGGGEAGVAGTSGTWQEPPVTTVTYSPSDEIFPNPERGFYRVVPLLTQRDFSSIRAAGYSLIFADVDLSAYRTRDLDDAFLTAFEGGFAAARKSGVKVVFRFLYNHGPFPTPEPDASEAWILRHLAAAKPVLQRNGDVIAVMQAGIIGAWGEWHNSTNGLLDDSATKFRIIEALLDALPVARATQIRRPGYKIEGYGAQTLGDDSAFDGSYRSRIGHHNDCFLTDRTDYGTYGPRIEEEKDYLSEEGLYLPMGGETCGVFAPRSECPSALAEMERLRWSFINNDYHGAVIASWSADGCRPDIERRLGYRFQLVSSDVATSVRPGGVLPVTVRVKNVGWAPPYNPRPVKLVLSGPTRVVVDLPTVDPRFFKPGQTVSFGTRMQLPGNLPAGTYTLSLWMPDAASSIQDDPRYAIRFGNTGLWDASTGTNRLAHVIVGMNR